MIGFGVGIWIAFLLVVVVHSRRRAGPLEERSEAGSRTMNAQYGVFFTALTASLLTELSHHFGPLGFLRFCSPWCGVRCLAHLPTSAPLQLVGAALLAGSFAAYLASARAISENYHPFVAVRRDQGLTTRGPYARVRHPLYASQMGMMCATALIFQNLFFALLPLSFYFFYRTAVEEERLLSKHFPGYGEYSRRTRRFIPGVF